MAKMVVEGLRYTQDHEWAQVAGDTATVGITDHAQEQLGEIVFVELPAVGKTFTAHQEIAVVESSKAASDVFAPVTGMVTEINSALSSRPEQINADCYGAGWICRMKITDPKSVAGLMEAQEYEEYLKTL
jgi:glycine cleavage system H protein